LGERGHSTHFAASRPSTQGTISGFFVANGNFAILLEKGEARIQP
jgi:hypothetical protein